MIAGQGMRANVWPPDPRLIRASLGLATLFCAMFLFRRWYAFAAVGIALTVAAFVAYDVWRAKRHRLGVLTAAVSSACLIAMGVLCLTASVLFDWVGNMQAHDYLQLYSAYRLSPTATLKLAVQALGVLVPTIVLAVVVIRLLRAGNRRLLLLLCGCTAVSVFLFLQVSSPGLHHYYLLMPLLGAGAVGAALALFRRNKVFALIGFFCFLGLSVSAPLNVNYGGIGYGGIVGVLTPGYRSWMTRHQVGKAGLVELGEWLTSPEVSSNRLCVLASSFKVNTAIVEELWQIAPAVGRHAFDGRMIQLGEVDSVSGSPWPSMKECEIALVGSPPQAHMAGRQYRVIVAAADLLGNEGIGVAFERLPQVFVLDDDTKIIAFRRKREITEDEFDDLVRRVNARRASSALLTPGS